MTGTTDPATRSDRSSCSLARLVRAVAALGGSTLVLALLLAAGGPGGPGDVARAAGSEPAAHYPPSTIVDVAGDAANGFDVHHLDGTVDHPPTDSEARAECSEYDTRVARVRCRTQVATYYRDLARLQDSLAYAYAH